MFWRILTSLLSSKSAGSGSDELELAQPKYDTVLYDGHCRFCQAQMKQLRWWDRGHRLVYLSLHDKQVEKRWPELSKDRLLEEMCIVDQQGHCHWGPEAVRFLSRRLPTLWWLAPLLHLPGSMFLWRPLYRFVAKNRYRIWGKTNDCEEGACSIHGR